MRRQGAQMRGEQWILLNFSMGFNTDSHNFLLNKSTKYELDKWTVQCVENWLSN